MLGAKELERWINSPLWKPDFVISPKNLACWSEKRENKTKEWLNWPKQKCIHPDMLPPAGTNNEHVKKERKESQIQSDFFSLALSPCYWQCAAGDFLASKIISPSLCLTVSTWYLIAPTGIVRPSCLILAVQKRTQPKGEIHPSFPHLLAYVVSKCQHWEQRIWNCNGIIK